MQRCPTCPRSRRRYIGPDLRSSGIFNYNNSILVTHELLDEYTSAYTSSETPFVSWVTQMARRYDFDDMKFMGQDLFRSIWFAYASLQHFVDDMTCNSCGTAPETTIWDGITLAFGKKHLQSSLRPPTTIHAESPVRSNVTYRPNQQLLTNPVVRKYIREALRGPSVANLMDTAERFGDIATVLPPAADAELHILPSPSIPQSSGASNGTATSTELGFPSPRLTVQDALFPTPFSLPSTPKRPTGIFQPPPNSSPYTPVVSPSKALLRQVSLVEKHIKNLKACTEALKEECTPLGELFEKYLGPEAYAKRQSCPSVWRSFFKQVWDTIDDIQCLQTRLT